jgi:hypothetical protein
MLSIEKLYFKDVRPGIPKREVVALSNKSENFTFNFKFKINEFYTYEDSLIIEPDIGSLPPKTNVLIKMTYIAAETRKQCSINNDLSLEIEWIEKGPKNKMFLK